MHSRKLFLSGLAVSALVPAAATAASPVPAATASPKPQNAAAERGFPFTFDRARFDTATRGKAPYKHVVAATKINQGRVFDVVSTIYDSYITDVGTNAADVLVGAVLYHGTPVALALDDAAWNDVVYPAIVHIDEAEIRDDLLSWHVQKGNPADRRLQSVAQYHAPFFVCRWAFGGMVGLLAKARNENPAELYKRMESSLIPSAILVPSGVWAIAELQHRGFSYQQAAL